MTHTVAVAGMTCDNCARHVAEALGRLEGVRDVRVDLSAGRATYERAQALPEADLRAALDEAGYDLA